MAHPKKARWAALAVPFAAVALAVTGLSSAEASSHHDAMTMGQDGFGKTAGNYDSHSLDFTYSKGYFCDATVSAASSTGCEVGAKWVKAPSKKHDPLYITVPLGFTPPQVLELLDLRRVLGGHVMGLGEVLREVVQLPTDVAVGVPIGAGPELRQRRR